MEKQRYFHVQEKRARELWEEKCQKTAHKPRRIGMLSGGPIPVMDWETSFGSADQGFLLYPDPSEFDKRIERFYCGPRIIPVPGFDRSGRRI